MTDEEIAQIGRIQRFYASIGRKQLPFIEILKLIKIGYYASEKKTK